MELVCVLTIQGIWKGIPFFKHVILLGLMICANLNTKVLIFRIYVNLNPNSMLQSSRTPYITFLIDILQCNHVIIIKNVFVMGAICRLNRPFFMIKGWLKKKFNFFLVANDFCFKIHFPCKMNFFFTNEDINWSWS